jgi:hypothetical protein
MKLSGRCIILFLLLWGALALLSQWIRICPTWPLWLPAAVTAVVMEFLVFLYRYERGAVTPGRARTIVALRIFTAVLLLWILIEPTWVRKTLREPQRQVVVVIDDSASMHLQDDGTTAPRIALAEKALAEAKVFEQLGKTLKVHTIRAARSVQEGTSESPAGWADSTDLAGALNYVLEQIPPDELAGVILASDGRHNRPERVEDVARRFGILDAPVGVLAVGAEEPPRDAAVVSVSAPEAIHLGDRMRINAKVKFDGYKGRKAKVVLRQGDTILEERVVEIPQDHHREDLRFIHLPKEGGVGDYEIEIGKLDGERFDDNNQSAFETSITDARTNVLIIDSHPRWEFRYLRNLFYGRDKSVHLQYVLFHPDRIEEQQNQNIPASATRPYGEAQATQLPTGEEEWRKFDVIILGDVERDSISDETWKIISRCVNERAALLVMVAGQRSMPHALVSAEARALVPVEMEWTNREYFSSAPEAFRWNLTAEGQSHPITQQSLGISSNEQMWAGFPEVSWRHPTSKVKEGAEVLLTAAYPEDQSTSAASSLGLNKALEDLSKKREQEAKHALLVTRQTGKGKVALLLTDRTWRLREGAGDVFHHRFWGNLVRWGAGPTLRAGGKQVRLGTDQLTYTPDDKIIITARLRDAKMAPVAGARIQAELLKDGKVVSTLELNEIEKSNGLYEADAATIQQAGNYQIRLKGTAVDTAAAADGLKEISTRIQLVSSRGPVEMAETTLNAALLETIASLSGGKVVDLKNAGSLPPLFLGNRSQREEIRETSLWDNVWVLSLLALALTAEWVLRRAGGLP